MQGYFLFAFLNALVAIPAIIAIVRFKLIKDFYLPFVLFIWIGCINEFLSIALAYTIGTSAANSNIYVLLEYILILIQFLKWNTISKLYAGILITLGTIVWITDNLLLNSISDSNSIFRIFYSLIIVFCSIGQLNKLIINERRPLSKHAVFLICISFLMFYSIKAFIEVFNAFRLVFGSRFNRNLFTSFYLVNFLSNIIYAIAIICIPKKQEFTLPY